MCVQAFFTNHCDKLRMSEINRSFLAHSITLKDKLLKIACLETWYLAFYTDGRLFCKWRPYLHGRSVGGRAPKASFFEGRSNFRARLQSRQINLILLFLLNLCLRLQRIQDFSGFSSCCMVCWALRIKNYLQLWDNAVCQLCCWYAVEICPAKLRACSESSVLRAANQLFVEFGSAV